MSDKCYVLFVVKLFVNICTNLRYLKSYYRDNNFSFLLGLSFEVVGKGIIYVLYAIYIVSDIVVVIGYFDYMCKLVYMDV